MIDVFNIPSNTQSTFTFYSAGAGVWQTWNKPRGTKMIEIFCLGGGGGGARTTNAAGNSGGGGGGGSAGIVRGIIPAFLLPDTLYILVGKGGAGGITSGGAGTAGGISYVSLSNSTSEQTLICKSSTATANGGSASAAGAAATISVVSLSAFGDLGLFTAIAGVIGGAGGALTPTSGGNQTALGTNLVTGGAGGGGKNTGAFASGATVTPATVILTSTVSGGLGTIPGTNMDGANGYGSLSPFCGTGGAGGAGSPTSTGGNGGNGYYGCGGAGGGGGNPSGNGGNGGDGLVIITVIS